MSSLAPASKIPIDQIQRPNLKDSLRPQTLTDALRTHSNRQLSEYLDVPMFATSVEKDDLIADAIAALESELTTLREQKTYRTEYQTEKARADQLKNDIATLRRKISDYRKREELTMTLPTDSEGTPIRPGDWVYRIADPIRVLCVLAVTDTDGIYVESDTMGWYDGSATEYPPIYWAASQCRITEAPDNPTHARMVTIPKPQNNTATPNLPGHTSDKDPSLNAPTTPGIS